MASLTALQYLPVPVLVLSSEKTVVLANEAMGRLLGIESDSMHGFSISEVLQDKSMGDLGVDILQNGSPIMVPWEVRSNLSEYRDLMNNVNLCRTFSTL
jgi:transcriptional regulator of aromatic amino acid metabolism